MDYPFEECIETIESCFRLKRNVQEPECIRDILINTAKHLGQLKFEVWKKMANIVRYGGLIRQIRALSMFTIW